MDPIKQTCNGYTLTVSNDLSEVRITHTENFNRNGHRIELTPEAQDTGGYKILITIAIVGRADVESVQKAHLRIREALEAHETFQKELNRLFNTDNH